MKTCLSILCLALALVMCLSGCGLELDPDDILGSINLPSNGTNANDQTTSDPTESTKGDSIVDKVEDALFGSYEDILTEYTKRLQEATPILIEEYLTEAESNQDGLTGLATLCNEKVGKLAVISNEGIQEMAQFYLKHGSGSYGEYSEWATKLQEVYMEEAAKIQAVYMESAT